MLRIKCLSSLEKVFSDAEPKSEQINTFSVLKNEKLSFQIAFCSDTDCKVKLGIGDKFNEYFEVFAVDDVPVALAANEDADDFYIKKTPGMYPDILKKSSVIDAKSGIWYSFWLTFSPKCTLTGGKAVDILLNDQKLHFYVKIVNALLPEQELIYTNWFHCDGICDYYNVKPFTDEFWRICKNFVRTAAEHGMNCILTPLFTPPLDTQVGGERTTVQLVKVKTDGSSYSFDYSDLKKWVEMCRSVGIKYFEMSHFFTQWGALHAPKIVATDENGVEKRIFGWETDSVGEEYSEFLSALSVGLKAFFKENNMEKCVFFHISDEPSQEHIETYKKLAVLIRTLFSEYRIIDALSDYDFYKSGSVDIPIPHENSIDDFYGKVDTLWTYYCCGQGTDNLPNRFIAMPSQRNRVLGTIMYRYGITGFLQWGYNFYNNQYSLARIDPYNDTDSGGAFPAGDPFVVYPGEDGEAVCSLRLKVFYEGLQDLRALKLLESLTCREYVLGLIGSIDIRHYPTQAPWLLNLHEKVNSEIQSKSKNCTNSKT